MAKTVLLILSLLFAPAVLYAADQGSGSSEKPIVKGMAEGIKKVTYDGPKDLVKETGKEIPKKPSINNMVEGVNRGTEKLLDHTVKGAYKVATLGKGELHSYEVVEPEKGSGEPTKIKIKIPGT